MTIREVIENITEIQDPLWVANLSKEEKLRLLWLELDVIGKKFELISV